MTDLEKSLALHHAEINARDIRIRDLEVENRVLKEIIRTWVVAALPKRKSGTPISALDKILGLHSAPPRRG
jgi:hypothetical protein